MQCYTNLRDMKGVMGCMCGGGVQGRSRECVKWVAARLTHPPPPPRLASRRARPSSPTPCALPLTGSILSSPPRPGWHHRVPASCFSKPDQSGCDLTLIGSAGASCRAREVGGCAPHPPAQPACQAAARMQRSRLARSSSDAEARWRSEDEEQDEEDLSSSSGAAPGGRRWWPRATIARGAGARSGLRCALRASCARRSQHRAHRCLRAPGPPAPHRRRARQRRRQRQRQRR